MALRIDYKSVIKGTLCNREKGKVTGEVWLRGWNQPVRLDLRGNPHRDLAGRTLSFTNPAPEGPDAAEDLGLYPDQNGKTGDITASRKVRVPTISDEEVSRCIREKREFPTVWKNSLYLEWFSIRNGRVVLEAPGFDTEISEPAWTMTDEEEIQAHRAAQENMVSFLDDVCEIMSKQDRENAPVDFSGEDDGPMDEFQWEKFMKESDRKTDRLMELYEKFGDDPDSDRKIADLMGWDLPDEFFEPPDQDEANDAPAIDTGYEEKDSPSRARFVHNPLSTRVKDLLFTYDLKNQEDGTPLCTLITRLMTLSAKLAGALDRLEGDEDEDLHDPGFTIACLKRCLPILDDALNAANEAGDQEPAITELFDVRQEILKRMEQLRSRL